MEGTSNQLHAIKDYIDNLDLSLVSIRMQKQYHWPKKHADKAITQYKNYLYLKRKYGDDFKLPPSLEIDEIWHNHILHTKEYHQDCQAIFGEYLHHRPSREGDGENLQTLFDKTQALYKTEFGDFIYVIRPTTKIGKCIDRAIFTISNFLTRFNNSAAV